MKRLLEPASFGFNVFCTTLMPQKKLEQRGLERNEAAAHYLRLDYSARWS